MTRVKGKFQPRPDGSILSEDMSNSKREVELRIKLYALFTDVALPREDGASSKIMYSEEGLIDTS